MRAFGASLTSGKPRGPLRRSKKRRVKTIIGAAPSGVLALPLVTRLWPFTRSWGCTATQVSPPRHSGPEIPGAPDSLAQRASVAPRQRGRESQRGPETAGVLDSENKSPIKPMTPRPADATLRAHTRRGLYYAVDCYFCCGAFARRMRDLSSRQNSLFID